ncbi:MAG: hypothetical protein LBD80_01210, partial [Tannerella sp.]|nr:hypothetical protein [Tannerella sp.]
MNKKIFTLLMGVIIAFGSAFTVSAQTPTVHNKLGIPVAFADNLRTDIVKDDFSPSSTSGNKYVIRLTGLANPTQDFQPLSNIFGDFSQDYVLFVDSVGQLRLDTLGNLDSEKYDFRFNGSSKFAALRRASWCINYRTDGPASLFSNVVFNFTNMESGWDIQSPGSGVSGWEADPKGFGRRIYKPASGGLDLSNTNLVLHSWHFSQTLGISNQPLQEKMPLYTHVSEENVAVLTIDAPYITPTKDGKGGWIVTVREVFADDLIADFQGNVREGANGVSNVLLFSLAKIQKFVLNADDYNAVADSIVFDPDAIGQTVAKNPFVRTGEGILKAFEVNDSLYRYGYLQFRQNVPGKSGWLVVDTDFVNFGNSEYLKFKFESFRRDTTFAANSKWGTEYYASGRKPIKEPVLTEIEEGIWNSSVYWRLDSLVWAVVKNLTGLGYMDESYIKDDGSIDVNKAFLKSGKEDVYKIVGGTNYNEAKTLWESIVTIGMDLRTDFSPFSNGLTLNKSGNNWTTIGGLFKNSDTIKSKGYPKAGEHYVSGHKDYNYKTDLFAAAETKYKADSALF